MESGFFEMIMNETTFLSDYLAQIYSSNIQFWLNQFEKSQKETFFALKGKLFFHLVGFWSPIFNFD